MSYPDNNTIHDFMRLEDLSRRHNPIILDATNNPNQINFPAVQTQDQYTRDSFHKGNLENLTRLGFKPETITATDGSKSLRLTGEDAKRFASLSASLPEMANKLIQSSPRQANADGSVTIKTPSGEHYHSHLSALVTALRVVGITAPETATYDHSNPIVSIQNNAKRDGIESILKPTPTHDHAILTLPKASIDNSVNGAEFRRSLSARVSSTPSGPPLHVQQIMEFNLSHRIGEDTPLAPGYKDGGRQSVYDANDGQTIIASKRESVTFKDPSEDPSLKRVIDRAKVEMAGLTSVAQKAEYLNKLVDTLLHKNDPDLNEKILRGLPADANGKRRVSLGDLIDNETGVCRHRTVLFKVLADNTGVPCAMVRGNFRDGNYGGGHAWNEVVQENGKRLLVDVMHGKVIGMNDPYARHYQDIQNRPMYDDKGPIKHAAPQPAKVEPAKPAQSSVQQIDMQKLSAAQHIIAGENITSTTKGGYIGVGKNDLEIATLKESLRVQGFEEGKHYTVGTSSLNQGGNVIKLTADGAAEFEKVKANAQAGKPPVMIAATPPAIDMQKLSAAQHVIAGENITSTSKGGYIGIGKNDVEIATLKESLRLQGFEEGKHYTVGTSSLNQGGNVIKLTADGAVEFEKVKANAQAGKPPVMVATAPPTPAAPPAPEPAKPAQPPAQQQAPKPVIAASVDLDLSQPPKAPAKTPEQHMAAASEKFRQEVSNPAVKPTTKVDLDLSDGSPKTTSGTKIGLSATGQKVDGHAGKAALAVEVASEAAKGNYGAAAATAAMAVAEQQGVKFVVKRIPVVGGLVTAGMTLFSAGAQAAQGNFKKAGSELIAGAAETAGNIVGFGLGDAAREGTRKLALLAGVKEENAPDKSGLRTAAESAYSLGKTITDASKLKLMSKTELSSAIQKDPNMVDTVSFKGNRVNLATALEDKEFRTKFLKQLESESKAGTDRSGQIAMIKAYEGKLETGTPVAPAAASVAQTAKPAATNITTPQAQAQATILNAQYKSMSTTQLADSILKDPVLPDTVAMNGKTISIKEAIKDGTFRDKLIANLESAQAKGTDLSQQIAMLKAYDTKMDASSQAGSTVTQVAQSQRPVQSPASISAPMA
jgi:hypothetical protein